MNAIAIDIGMALCSAATAYALLALVALFKARRPVRAVAAICTPVSILKPLHGVEPRLYDNLRSFCLQDYPSFQLLFGVRDEADPALEVARRIRREFPKLDIAVVVDARLHGHNHKVSNLTNILDRAHHPLLVIADSDICVGPDYLRRVCAPLARPDVGIVTCLYRGRALGGQWSRLGALFINEWFAPAVHIAQLFGSQAFGFGATLALRRETLDAIGGFQSITDELADDYRLAERVREAGLRTELSDYVVTTDVIEQSARQLMTHELRWLRTIRMLNPLGYAFMFISSGLAVATLGAALTGWTAAALVLLAIVGIARAALHFAVTPRTANWPWRAVRSLPLVVLRDVLNLVLWGGAFASRQVAWAGRELHLR
ncbi:MAG: bacteriohopanetetrol glucosamine biosynthesis glycosyltransferase HpnI [Xanthomonadaceae bacterium]|nr:bacteriohopanetetrol glucosamine biosynthesis glycosyltransferase HpnI [Xanthomonadaceae bacterium]